MAPDYITMLNWSPEQHRAYRDSLFKYNKPVRVETKKERLKRIAKEKMLASWNLFNQETETIIKIKQFCKPRHVFKPLCGRAFKH